MDFSYFKKYNGINKLDSILAFRKREKIKNSFIDLTILLIIWVVLSPSFTPAYTALAQGLTLFSLSISLFLICIEGYYYDFYFNDLPTVFQEPHFKKLDANGSYVVSKIIEKVKKQDITTGFFNSEPGKILALRLDIPQIDINKFTGEKKNKILLNQFEMKISNENDLFESFVSALYNQDVEFKDFIFKFAIREKDLVGTAKWITKQYEREKREKRWWGRDNMAKAGGIGTDWSYGEAYALEKYASRIEDSYDFSVTGLGHHNKEVSDIENILSKRSEANVLLVADDDFQKTGILIEFSKKVLGDRFPALRNKKVLLLDINNVLVGKKTKAEFEEEIINIWNDAERAGNIILVIKDLPSSIVNAKALDSDLLGLLGPYFDSTSLQTIALSDTRNFHQYIETNISAMSKFESILLKEDTEDSLIYSLQKNSSDLEHRYGVFFTYQSLSAIAENASRYFMGQIVSDKVSDLLVELPQNVLKQGRRTVTKKDVLDIVERKTGIPVGEIKEKEKNKLLNLEKILHDRVVSQNEAISAISSTLRRARSGIESGNKPMGSFLFLGPTGVGKTETAKALSEVFFDSDKKIIRLDMSEYSGPDSLSKLIGSFESGKQGVLTSLLRENQYGVLLLDEFEKANYEVHNLFLQILDEGVFSDMVGKKVNARNLIIIATSNAGSGIIWDYVKTRRSLNEGKQDIIDKIIREGTFRPELINRFDGVILFHPLSNDDLRQITTLMLQKLSKRIEEKGLELTITDELVDFLMRKGSDPTFGARPINRAIQDNVEEIIAKKLIQGETAPGSKITISKEELELTNNK